MSGEIGYSKTRCDDCDAVIPIPHGAAGAKLCIDCENDRLKSKFGEGTGVFRPNTKIWKP